MKTEAICAILAAGLVLAGCQTTAGTKQTRAESVRGAVAADLGLRGRFLVNDLGQVTATRLRPGAARLAEEFLLLEDVHHRVHSLDRGSVLSTWEFQGFDGEIRFPATFNASSLLLMSGNRLFQIDRRYGHMRGGAIYFDMAPSAPFVATEGTAFVPSWGGGTGQKTLRTLNLVTGLEGWGYRTPGDIRGAMALGGAVPRQTVYFATDAGEVYALPATGSDFQAPEPLWTTRTHGANTADLVLDGDSLFVASQDNGLYCLDRITGRVAWCTFLNAPLTEAPVVTAGAVYQRNALGLHCLDRRTGTTRWRLSDQAHFVVEREGKVVVQGSDGALWLVRPDGSVAARANPGRFTYPANSRDGTLYAVANDGYITALEVGGE